MSLFADIVKDKICKQSLDMIREICIEVIAATMEKEDRPDSEKKEIAAVLVDNVLHGESKVQKKVVEGNEDRCIVVLKTGKNKGLQCSIKKSKGINYCTRHFKSLTKKGELNLEEQKESMISKMALTPVFYQYGDSDLYINEDHSLLALKKNEKYVVGAAIDEEGDIHPLNARDKATCELSGVSTNDKLYDQIYKLA